MNISTKLFATALLAAGTVIGASANELVDPNPNATFEATSLETLILKFKEFTSESAPTQNVLILNESEETVSTGTVEADPDIWSNYNVTFTPAVTDYGNYVMVIPENLDPAGSPEYKIKVVLKEDNSPICVPSTVLPTPNSALVQGTQDFTTINLNFENEKAGLTKVDFDLIKLTAADGTIVPYTTGGVYDPAHPMFSMVPCPNIALSFNNDGTLASGDYTLTIPAGAIESSRGVLESNLSYTWSYTKTLADNDPTPLTLTSALLGQVSGEYKDGKYIYTWMGENAVPFTDGMSHDLLKGVVVKESGTEGKPGSALLLDFNHGHKTNTLEYTLYNVTTNENMKFGYAVKQEDGKFLIVFPEDIKLIEGNEYEFDFHAFSNEGQPRAEFGKGCKVKVIGTAEPYKYSAAQFVASAPSDGGTIRTAADNVITVVFNAPVKARAELNLGMGTSAPLSCESKSGNETDAVWFVTLDGTALSYPSVNIAIFATGEDGLVVYGESGFEDSACNMINFDLQVSQPRALLGNSNSHVESIDKISFYCEKDQTPILHSWMGKPYITDMDGEKVSEAIEEYVPNYLTGDENDLVPFKVIRSIGEGYDQEPLELEYKFEPALTTPGRYKLVLPESMFNFGTQYDSESSVPQEFSLWVVDYVDVNYSVDNHTVALPKVEKGKTAELNLTVAENWKLESLTLNGEDVTGNVTDGHYVTPALSDNANIAAKFVYDGEIFTPAGVDDVVSDLNLRGWSENGTIYVAGLKKGQILNVYTIGGSLMNTLSVNSEDIMKINVPENATYIVTVTEEGKTAALKIQNK